MCRLDRPALPALLLLAASLTLASAAGAQMPADHAHHGPHTSPYAGLAKSGIAGLSPDEVSELEAGEGMGLALPAELNSYPGPRHVLDMVAELGLDADRVTQVQQIFDEMHADAVRIGAQIVEEERTLDLHFQHGHIDDAILRELTDRIAGLEGELRFTHLRAHLATTALLSPGEIATYNRLRGYTAGPSPAAGPAS
jgi:hypothetical protein